MGQGEALLGCTEEDIRQERKKLRQTEEQAEKVSVLTKDGWLSRRESLRHKTENLGIKLQNPLLKQGTGDI